MKTSIPPVETFRRLICLQANRCWQKNRQEPLNTRLPQILSVIQPAVPATWEEFFCQRLSELARSFVREFLTPSAEFQTFCQERYKKITDNPNLLRRRIFEYLGCENRRRKEIVAELRLKLSGSLARAS